MQYIIVLVDQAISGESADYYTVVDTATSVPTVVARCLTVGHAATIRDALNGA